MGRTRTGPDGERLTDAKSAEKTKEDLLRVGIERLKNAPPPPPAEARLRVSDIVHDAGLSSGAFYYAFEDLADYKARLLEKLLGPEVYAEPFDQIADAWRQSEGRTPVERVAEMTVADLHSLLALREWPIQMAYLLSADVQSAEAKLLQENYRECDQATVDTYGEMLRGLGLKMRPPFSEMLLARLLIVLVEGAALRARVDPEATGPSDDSDGLPLVAVGALALLAALTTEDDGSTQPLREELDRRWAR